MNESHEWPMFGGNAQHTGTRPQRGIAAPRLLYKVKVGSETFSSPLVVADTVYVMTYRSFQSVVVALDSTTGVERWYYAPPSLFLGCYWFTPAISDRHLYLAGFRMILILNADTGEVVQKMDITRGSHWEPLSPLLLYEQRLYVTSDQSSDTSCLHAFSLATLEEQWRFTIPLDLLSSSPAGWGECIYFGAGSRQPTGTGWLFCVDQATGHEVWRFPTAGSVWSSPTIAHGRVYITSYGAAECIYAVDATSGALCWVREIPYGDRKPRLDIYPKSAVGVDEEAVYVGSRDGRLRALAAATGEVLWEFATEAEIASSPTLAGTSVYVGSNDGNVYAIECTSGREEWRMAGTDAIFASPAVVDDRMYFSDIQGHLYAVGT
jgi:outer membrane protein assembly factor BamB